MEREYISIESCLPKWITSSPDNYVILLDETGRFLYSNQTFLESVDATETQMNTYCFDDVMSNSLKSSFQNIFKLCEEFENGMRNLDLDSKLSELSKMVRCTWEFHLVKIDGNQAVVGMGQRIDAFNFQDKRSFNSHLSKAIDNNALISLTDPKGRILMVNDTFCQYTKFDRFELIGFKHRDVFQDFHSKSFWRKLIDDVRRGDIWSSDVKIQSKFGDLYWFHTMVNPIMDANGNLVQLLHIQFDITSHKKMEEERTDLSDKYNKISANFPGFVFQYILHPDGSQYFPFTTDGVKEIFDIPQDILRIDANPAFAKVHSDDLENLKKSIAFSAENLTRWYHSYRISQSPKKEIWVQGIAKPEKQEDGSVIWHGFIYDITEEKKAESRLKKQKEKLAEIAFIQAHEFRRPVANMLGIFDILKLQNDTLTSEQYQYWLELMYESVKETDQIIAKIVMKASEEEKSNFYVS